MLSFVLEALNQLYFSFVFDIFFRTFSQHHHWMSYSAPLYRLSILFFTFVKVLLTALLISFGTKSASRLHHSFSLFFTTGVLFAVSCFSSLSIFWQCEIVFTGCIDLFLYLLFFRASVNISWVDCSDSKVIRSVFLIL